jgi:hypothetical protein
MQLWKAIRPEVYARCRSGGPPSPDKLDKAIAAVIGVSHQTAGAQLVHMDQLRKPYLRQSKPTKKKSGSALMAKRVRSICEGQFRRATVQRTGLKRPLSRDLRPREYLTPSEV